MIEVRILKPSDDRTRFRSGNTDLDRFFVRYAGQNQFRHHIGTTYVAVENNSIKGFATVSPFDRIIIAEAVMRKMTVLTRDERLAEYGVQILW